MLYLFAGTAKMTEVVTQMSSHLKVKFQVLQPPTISINGEIQRLRSKKGEALLYYLLIEKKCSRDTIASLLWEKEAASEAKRHLRDTIYLLRKQIGDVIVPFDKFTLQLNPEFLIESDIDTLLQERDPSVYHSEFLKEFHFPDSVSYENWVQCNREKFREAYLKILTSLIRESSSDKDTRKTEEYLSLYLMENPIAESIAVQMMELYRNEKEYGKAVAVYQKLHKNLSDEMGITPLKDTANLYYAIIEEWNCQSEADQVSSDTWLSNRQSIYTSLENIALQGEKVKAVIISGASGVGKTYVLNRLLSSNSLNSYTTITASCYKTKRETSFYAWQAIISGLVCHIENLGLYVPDIYAVTLAPVFDIFVSARKDDLIGCENSFFSIAINDAVIELIRIAAKKGPLTFVFENIHWMDSMSVSLLDSVIRALRPTCLLIFATAQPPFSETLTSFFDVAQEDGILSIQDLPAFTEEETFLFIDQHGGKQLSQDTKVFMYSETNGNALLLLQLISYLKTHGNKKVGHLDINDEISFRTSGLSRDSLHILNLISLFPEDAPYELISHVCGKTTQDILLACQDLRQRMLITENNNGGRIALAFVRPEYRDVIYKRLPLLDRQVMHRAIAETILQAQEPARSSYTGMLEYHYQQGGDYLKAFDQQVQRLSAYIGGSYDMFRNEIGQSNFEPNTDAQTKSLLQEMDAGYEKFLAEYGPSSLLDTIQSRILCSKALYGISTGNYEFGLPALQEILLRCRKGTEMCGFAHRQMSNYAIQIYNLELLDEHIRDGIESAQLCGDQKTLATLERYKGLLYLLRGEYPHARQTLQTAIEKADKAYPAGIARNAHISYARNYIGESFRGEARYSEALAQYKAALLQIQPYGFMTSRPVFYTNLGCTYLAMGECRAAKESFELGLQIYSTVRVSLTQSIAAAFMAIFAFAEGNDEYSISLLQEAEKNASQLQSPKDSAIISLVKAILRKRCDFIKATSPLAEYLDQPYSYYASKVFLFGKLGVYEKSLLNNLFSSKSEDDMLSKIWQGAY